MQQPRCSQFPNLINEKNGNASHTNTPIATQARGNWLKLLLVHLAIVGALVVDNQKAGFMTTLTSNSHVTTITFTFCSHITQYNTYSSHFYIQNPTLNQESKKSNDLEQPSNRGK